MPIKNLDKKSVVAASIVHTLSWRERKAKLITQAEGHVLSDVFARLLPLIGAEALTYDSPGDTVR